LTLLAIATTVLEILATVRSLFLQIPELEFTLSFGIGFSTETLLLEEKNTPLVLM
jgi:hypothetical protein